MHILVLGAAGMVGRKLSERLLRDGRLGKRDIIRMTLQDVVAAAKPEKAGFPVDVVAAWTSDRHTLTVAVLNPTDVEQPLHLDLAGANLAGSGTL